ncbi:MAG TPA: SH3 domain-containing protein [Acetobacteraceae bacterium]|nr:SH3 domain-containing protein [Acetobacteraceae bacterium]
MAFLRPAILSACLIAPAAAAQQQPAPAPSQHIVAAPQGPVREAPAHRGKSGKERTAVRGRAPAKEPAAAAKPEPQAAEAAKPAAPAKPAPPPPDTHIGTVTGLPLPRFAALRADQVNFRAGPGDRYPVEWLYKRRGLPVEIEREFDVWRLVTAPDGTKGWVHEATLMGRRDFVVTGAERTLRAEPQDTARPVAVLKPGVVGRINACPANSEWCRVQVSDYRGWIKRDGIWGVLPGETVAPG